MNEKKLTDEEIVKALYYLKGQYISYIDDDDDKCKLLFVDDILDLIHRLQGEKKELKSIAEYQQGSNMERWQIIQEKDKTIAEQKAEIERLTELQARGSFRVAELGIENAELQKQVDELKEERYYTEQDTAKEIFTALYHREEMGFDVIKWFAKEYYGVEVE